MTRSIRVLVTGATGNVGRHVVAGLAATGANVRALVRDPQTAAYPDGIELVRGDLTDPDTLPAALDGVDAVFLLWPFFTSQGAQPMVDLLARHVRRVVYLSAMSVQDAREPRDNGVWGEIEQLIERTGLEWTFLRAGGFATNTLDWAEQIRTEGVVRFVHGGAGRSLIHERDIADVAVRALTEDQHVGAKYVLTGPEVLTQAEQVRTIGEVIGRPARWEEIPPEVARQQLLTAWGNPVFVDGALRYWAELVTQPELVTDTVARLTGTPARTFREWVHDHADDFLPPPAADIADRYVSAFRKGDIDEALRLMATDVVRVAPIETGGEPVELRGVQTIMENSERLNADYELHRVDIDGPFVAEDRFAVRFAFDETHAPSGERRTTVKMSLYTVASGRITREEVYYHTPVSAPAEERAQPR